MRYSMSGVIRTGMMSADKATAGDVGGSKRNTINIVTNTSVIGIDESRLGEIGKTLIVTI